MKINTKEISKQAKIMMAGLMSMAVIGGVAPSIVHSINTPVHASRVYHSYQYYQGQLKRNQKKLRYAQKKHYNHWAKKLQSAIRYDARHARKPQYKKRRAYHHKVNKPRHHESIWTWYYHNGPKFDSSKYAQTDAYKKGFNDGHEASDGYGSVMHPQLNSTWYKRGWINGMATSGSQIGNNDDTDGAFDETDSSNFHYAYDSYNNGIFFAKLHGYDKIHLPFGGNHWYATKKEKKVTAQRLAQNGQNQSQTPNQNSNSNPTVNF